MSTDGHHEDDLVMKQAWWDRFHDLKLADSKEQLERIIKEHEGVSAIAYPDSKGTITAGVGFNMDQPGAKAVLDALGIPFEPVHSGKAQLTSEQIDALLNHSISGAIEDLKSIFPKFDQLSAGRQMALVDMMFMGKPKFEGFVEMIGAVKGGNWDKAAKEMGNSLWAEQVHERRAGPDMEAMRTGNYPATGKGEITLPHLEARPASRGGVPDAGAHPAPLTPRPDKAPVPQPGTGSLVPGGDKISPPQGRVDLLQDSGKSVAPAADPVLAKALAAFDSLIQTSPTLGPTQVPGRETPFGRGDILPGGSPGAMPPSTGPGQNSPLSASPLADKTPAGQVQPPPGLGASAPSSSSQGGQGSGSGGGQGSNVAGDPVLAKALAAAGPIASVQVQPEVKPVVTPVPAGPLLS